MKRIFPILILWLLVFTNSRAQWTDFNLSWRSYQTIRKYDSNFLYGSTYKNNYFIKSTDGGKNWQVITIKDTLGASLLATFYSVHFLSPLVGYAAGDIHAGDDAAILKTKDGGNTWTVMGSQKINAIYSGYNKLFFADANTAYAGGTDGAMVKSVNGGTTWNSLAYNFYKEEIKGIYFKDKDTGFVATFYHAYKTTNGGANWDTIPGSQGTMEFSFLDKKRGYAIGGRQMQTLDGGNTWQIISGITQPYLAFCGTYLSPDTAYFGSTTKYVFRTTDGGKSWEDYYVGNFQDVRDLIFYSSDTGYLAGHNLAQYTYNHGMPWKPYVSATLKYKTNCPRDTFYFTNTSGNPGWTYNWQVNGKPMASTYNFAYVPPDTLAGKQVTVLVIGNNGQLTDTALFTFTLTKPASPPTISYNKQSYKQCDGYTGCITINTKAGLNYKVLEDTTVLYSVAGTGSSVNYCITIKGNKTITLYADYIGPCGEVAWDTVQLKYYSQTQKDLVPFVKQDSVCYKTAVKVYIPDTEPTVSYKMYIGTDQIKILQGTGDTLEFTTPPLDTSCVITFQTDQTASTNCQLTLSTKLAIYVYRPRAYFTMNTFNPVKGQAVTLLNNSVSYNGSYTWNFGAGGVPKTSTALLPTGVKFNLTGKSQVKLKVTTPQGCIDSLVRDVHVLTTGVPTDTCQVVYLLNPNIDQSQFVESQFDQNGEYATTTIDYVKYPETGRYKTYADMGDTLADITNPALFNSHVIKYNRYGVAKWSVGFMQPAKGLTTEPYFAGVAFDSKHNMYVAKLKNFDELAVQSADGSVTSFKSLTFDMVLCKFDSMGMLQWGTIIPASFNTLGTLKVMVDASDDVYMLHSDNNKGSQLAKFSPTGQLLWQVKRRAFMRDIALDTNQEVWILSNDYSILHVSAAGAPIDSLPAATTTSTVLTYRFQLDNAGNIYIAGKFTGQLTLGSTVFQNGSAAESVLLTRMDKTGALQWSRQFYSSKILFVAGLTIDQQTLAMAIDPAFMYFDPTAPDSIYTPGVPAATFLREGSVIVTSDLNNTQVNIYPIYEPNEWGHFATSDALHLHNGRLQITLRYKADNYVMNDTLPQQTATGSNYAILNYNLGCLGSAMYPHYTPHSAFSVGPIACEGKLASMHDSSTHSPLIWKWQFPGGTPATSSLKNPTVTYPAAGTYDVYLVTQNQYGTGDTAHSTITVAPMPVVTLTLNKDTVCAGGGTAQLTGAPAGGSYSGTGVSGSVFTAPASATGKTYTVNYSYANPEGCSSTATKSIYAKVCSSGMEEMESAASTIRMYPNPAKDVLMVSGLGNCTLEVLDVTGRILLAKETTGTDTTLPLANLAPGMYLLKASTTSGVVMRKFIKE